MFRAYFLVGVTVFCTMLLYRYLRLYHGLRGDEATYHLVQRWGERPDSLRKAVAFFYQNQVIPTWEGYPLCETCEVALAPGETAHPLCEAEQRHLPLVITQWVYLSPYDRVGVQLYGAWSLSRQDPM